MTLRLKGSTSGHTEVKAPASAGSNTLTLPTSNGSAEQFLKNSGTAGELEFSSMVETSTGVGIGTTSPSKKLHIVPSGSNAYDAVQIGDGLYLGNTSNNNNAALFHQGGGADLEIGSQQHITFTTGNIAGSATERLRIDSSGKVGIGTTSPGRQLQINGDSDTQIRVVASAGGAAGIQFGDTADTVRGSVNYDVSDNSLQLRGYNNTERMRIDSSGRLGVGTSAPYNVLTGKSLSIGNGVGAAEVNFLSATDGYGAIYFGDGTSGNARYRGYLEYDHTNDSMRFGLAASERMRIDSSGNVGIGTSSFNSTASGRQILEINGASSSLINLDVGGTRKAYHFTDGTDVYSYNTANGNYIFGTNDTERMRIDSAGAVTVKRASTYTTGLQHGLAIQQGSATNGNRAGLVFQSLDGYSVAGINGVISTHSGTQNNNVGYLEFYTKPSGVNAATERMRISSNGRMYVGATGTYTSRLNVLGESGQNACSVANPSTGGVINFFANSTTEVGFISVSASSTTYSTSSDYRLKENVVDIADGITRVKQLQPKRFNFIADADTTVDGFLAHEAQTVVPEAVTGEKDGEEMQGIDQSKLVPLLTAALQEAITKIETLETKVAALEAG